MTKRPPGQSLPDGAFRGEFVSYHLSNSFLIGPARAVQLASVPFFIVADRTVQGNRRAIAVDPKRGIEYPTRNYVPLKVHPHRADSAEFPAVCKRSDYSSR